MNSMTNTQRTARRLNILRRMAELDADEDEQATLPAWLDLDFVTIADVDAALEAVEPVCMTGAEGLNCGQQDAHCAKVDDYVDYLLSLRATYEAHRAA